jgi:carbon storage regulator
MEVEMAGRLVLTRNRGESVIIGDEVEIAVLELRSGQVKLGIVAPASVPVHRSEIWLRVVRERQAEARGQGRKLPDSRTPAQRLDGEAA